MRALLVAILCLPLVSSADDFTDGNQAYAKGNFAEAQRLYEKAARAHPAPNVFFNAGDAAFRLNDIGHAALNYERALLLDPTHPESQANLKFARNKTAAKIGDAEWMEKAGRFIAQPLATWLLIGEAWLGFALIAAAVFGRKSRAGLIFGALLVVLGGGGIPALAYARGELKRVAVVTATRSEARTEPADRATIAETLTPGSRVRVISDQGDWSYCILPAGNRGWLPAKTIARIVPEAGL
jgi:hypothetical protein